MSECCKILLSATPLASSPTESLNDGANALFLAAQNNHLETLKVLKKYGCSSNHIRKDSTSSIHISAQLGHYDIIAELLNLGEKDYEKPDSGATALFKASQRGHHDIVKLLLNYKPNLGLLKVVCICFKISKNRFLRLQLFQNGESCLHAAALFGNLSIARMLIDAGSNPRLPNKVNIICLL